MSKKKAFSGNTMTLKDFHGGTIPSDLPLPSAPGVTDRISDRLGYDHRPLPWGINPTGRADQRSRLTSSSSSSSSSTRHFEDTTSFLCHAAPIGRNFDEDERKPLDGMPPGPRPTVGDDGGVWVLELKRHQQQPQPPPFYAAGRLSSSQQQQVQDVVGTQGKISVTSSAAWSMRKEAVTPSHPVQSATTASTGASKLIHASAIEKVTSGRWHSRQHHHDAAFTEEADRGFNAAGYYSDEKHIGAITVGERRRYLINSSSSSSEENHRKGKDILLDTQLVSDKNAPMHVGGAFQRGHEDGRVPSTEPQESEQRPKLKLLPRSKLSETPDQPHGGHKQPLSLVNQKPVDHPHSEFIIEVHASAQLPAQVAVTESASQMVERPKLNLKPRSQPLKQLEGIAERDRTAVYGGARPRELVLKERRVDEVVNSYELGQSCSSSSSSSSSSSTTCSSDRSKINNNNNKSNKSEGVSGRATVMMMERNGRKVERHDVQQRKSYWRNESWSNGGERQESPPPPDIWRKPVEDPPCQPTTLLLEKKEGIRFGKAASAAELAQAFSRSCSVLPNKFSGQSRGTPQLPFSRLAARTSTST